MINTILISISIILGIFAGEIISQYAFGSLKDVKKVLLEMVSFIILINIIMVSISIRESRLLLIILIYFIISFFSIISIRSLIFIVFRTVNKSSVFFKKNLKNERLIRLAKRLKKKYTKKEIIKIFKNSGYSDELINLFKKTL